MAFVSFLFADTAHFREEISSIGSGRSKKPPLPHHKKKKSDWMPKKYVNQRKKEKKRFPRSEDVRSPERSKLLFHQLTVQSCMYYTLIPSSQNPNINRSNDT